MITKAINITIYVVRFIGYLFIYAFEASFKIFKLVLTDLVSTYAHILLSIRSLISQVFLRLKVFLPKKIIKYKRVKHHAHRLKSKLPKIAHPFLRYAGIFLAGGTFSVLFIFIPFVIYSWFKELPNPELLIVDGYGKNTRILDKKGRLLYEIYIDKNFQPVKLSDLPDSVIKSTIAVEDAEFYTHKGISLRGITRALRSILFDNKIEGGSTITQQLVKNVLLSPERTLSRKLKEAALAVLVETKYSKEQILELYFNNIPYGGTAWGIESAARKYFGKDAKDLDLAEAALLAGLPSSPTTYSPLTDLELAKSRQKHVLDRMVLLKYIDQTVADSANTEELKLVDQGDYIRAPHFVNYVKNELEKRFGSRYVNSGGLTVYTTLDLDLQEKAQDIVAKEVGKSSYLNISNGAAVVLDVKDDSVLAYVGSVDYFKDKWGAYDVVTSLRQPGSSIKPVTYALAFSAGYTPASVISDEPVKYTFEGEPPYIPVNYDGKFHGSVTLRQALANSYNIPAVKLAAALGPSNIVGLGNELGLKNWRKDDPYGLSVTLGGKEVRLLDLANVYSTFARSGVYRDVKTISSVKDSRGNEIYSDGWYTEKQVLSNEVTYLLWHILSDNNARLPAFGVNNSLTIPGYKIAVKTGTTDQKRDNWTFGFTPNYVVGVWVGNNDNREMNPRLASGLSGAAPIWNQIMAETLKGSADVQFSMPANVFAKSFPGCGNRSEVFIYGTKIPDSICGEKVINKGKVSKSR